MIAPYLNGNQFVALGELEAAPYVVGQRDGKILSADGDVAYVKGEAVLVGFVWCLQKRPEAF